MRPVLEAWLAPFRDLGVTTVSIRNTGGTDHLSFNAVGLPGFQFIQDPLDYGSITHHSSMDTWDHAVPEDLMQASAVIASLVYETANRKEMLPRRELPKAVDENSMRRHERRAGTSAAPQGASKWTRRLGLRFRPDGGPGRGSRYSGRPIPTCASLPRRFRFRPARIPNDQL